MKIKDNSYNFGRCLKVTFTNILNDEMTSFTIEHAPDLNRDLYVAMDVTVTDRPSASSKGNPGFQGTVTVFNPTKELLNIINGGATWVSDYVNENQSASQKMNAIDRFYASRLTCTISAGYINDNGEPSYTVILKGYVNGSSLARKGVEEVLTFGVFDIDMMRESQIVEKESSKKTEADRILDMQNTNKFETTWYQTLVKYIKQWEVERIPDPQSMPETRRKNAYNFLSTRPQQQITPLAEDRSRITNEDFPLIPVSNFDRQREDWFEIKFVKSVSDWLARTRNGGRDWGGGAIDVKLQEALTAYVMPANNAVYGINLAQMLDGLCAVVGRIGWHRDITNRTRNTYLIYELGNEPLWVSKDKADIQIWNYQNLLESPSVSGAGIMTVKMVFNPECVCHRTLALILDPTVVSKDGATRDISGLESGLYGSMATQSSLANFGNVQISGSNAVAALNKGVQDGKSRGYLFNIGFPIVSVKHELSTYGNNWSTTVQTVPATVGLKYKKGV